MTKTNPNSSSQPDNAQISALLEEMADRLEMDEANVFRIRAIRRGSEVIHGLGQNAVGMDRKDLLALPGIGKGLADMIEELGAKGQISELEALRKKFPPGVMALLDVQGLGPKRAALVFKKLKIDSPEKLAEAARKGNLSALPGFGKKLEEAIIKSLAFAETSKGRVLLSEAREIMGTILDHLTSNPAFKKCEPAGSLRRWKETCGDLDILCESKQAEKAIDHFLAFPGIARTLGAGKTKASVVLNSGIQVDFRVVPPDSFGAALMYFTGSKEHNVRLRELARKKGLTLNEYGLFKQSDKKQTKPVASKTEKDIYNALGLPWIPPELREDRGEVDAGLKDALPSLVELEDIQGDFHNHTNLSDGADSLEDMIRAAEKMKWPWFFSADHSPSLTVANGLSPARLKKKKQVLENLQKKSKKIKVFLSSEVDILADGSLDYPAAELKSLGAVVGSVHSRFNMSQDEMTARVLKAVRNPQMDILGHLTGRLISRRPGYPLDIEAVLKTAAETRTAVEINGQPDRAELKDGQVKRAIELGVPLAVSTDAHSSGQLSNMIYAVHIARRGWAEKKHIINTRSAAEVLKWLDR